MRPVSQLKVFIAHIAVGIFALAAPAAAATVFVNTDTTLTTGVTGDAGADGAGNNNGATGNSAVVWTAADVDVLVNAGLTFTGGAGGNGGSDDANTGSNISGGSGGHGFAMVSSGTVSASGIFVYGGAGGIGSDGGASGGSDVNGGGGGDGGHGIWADIGTLQISLTDSIVTAGDGGNGGDAGDVLGDATDDAWGESGGWGGHGILLLSTASGASVTLNNTAVTGGNGGAGGVSLAPTTNANGGDGGYGIMYFGGGIDLTIGAGSIVQGGEGGAVGTGGIGGSAGIDGAGVILLGFDATLTNHGTILGGNNGLQSGEAAVVVAQDTTLIDNYGAIGAAADHAAEGLFVNGGTLSMLHNRAGGIIQTSGSNPAIYVGAGQIANFVNEGSIVGGSGSGVRVDGAIGTFVNSGLIQAGNSAALAFLGAGVPDLIDNSGGTITNNSVANATVSFSADLGAAGVTIKGGQVLSGGSAAAIEFGGSQTAAIIVDGVNVGGTIKFDSADETLIVSKSMLAGGVVFGGGNNNLNFDSPGVTTIAPGSVFANASFFTLLAGSNVVSNAEQTDLNSSIGVLTTVAGSMLTLNEDFLTDGTSLNQGTLVISPGAALNSTGSFTSTGTIVFGVAADGTAGQVHSLNGIDLTGSTVEIDLANPASTFVAGTNLLLASDFDLGAIDGVVNGTQLADNSALMTFLLYRGDAPEIGGNSYQLFAQVQQALLADIAGEGDDPNSIALGATLDEIGLDGDADLDDLMLALALLQSNEDINQVLDALLPETDGIAYDIATDMGDQALDVASKRLDTLLADRLGAEYRVASAAPVGLRGSVREGAGRFWVQGFGRAVDQSRHNYNTGYDAGSVGFALGADANLDKATAVGAAFSYASTDADGNGVNFTDTEVDSYQLTLYGDHLFGNAVYAKGLLAYGWHANDIARHNVGGIPGNTATGSYDADHVTVRAELGRAYKAGGALTLLPRVHANAASYSPEGYSEQGVGGLGLTVAPENLTSVRLGLGALARWDIALSGGALLQPELRLDYRRDLTRERFETVSEFLGAPGVTFVTQGVEPPADILNIGVGAVLATAGGVDFRASYDVELKDDYVAHAGYVRASIPF